MRCGSLWSAEHASNEGTMIGDRSMDELHNELTRTTEVSSSSLNDDNEMIGIQFDRSIHECTT